MASVEERIHIHRPVPHVWALLCDWESQSDWMQDARSVTVTSDHRTGVGVRMRVPTDVALGIVVTDEMVVTEWVEERRIAVRHDGRTIRGHGAFELRPTSRPGGQDGTLFTWTEEVEAPFGRLGDLVATYAVVPYVSMVFRRSLRALKRVAESSAAVAP